MRAGLDLLDRANSQVLQRLVVELAAVVVAHGASDHTTTG
jgi:hypothetical protein